MGLRAEYAKEFWVQAYSWWQQVYRVVSLTKFGGEWRVDLTDHQRKLGEKSSSERSDYEPEVYGFEEDCGQESMQFWSGWIDGTNKAVHWLEGRTQTITKNDVKLLN